MVLIDAGSTLTEDDLATIRTLYEAGIPASVLLSKSDLLSDEDRGRSCGYISGQIAARLGLALSVRPVSIQPSHASLLDTWLSKVILPLFDRHQQLAQESLARKIGTLREAVTIALETRLGRVDSGDAVVVEAADKQIRSAVGRIAEVRERCSAIVGRLRDEDEHFLLIAATALADAQPAGWSGEMVRAALVSAAGEYANEIFRVLKELARELAGALQAVANNLNFAEAPSEEDFGPAIREMPKLDLGPLEIKSRPGITLKFSRELAIRRLAATLRREPGPQISQAFASFGSILDAWARRTLADLQQRFETHADAYRAQLSRMTAGGRVSESDRASMERDVSLLDSGGGEIAEALSE